MEGWSEVPSLTKDEVESIELLEKEDENPETIKDHIVEADEDDKELLNDMLATEVIQKVFHSHELSESESLKQFEDQKKWLDTNVQKLEIVRNGPPYPNRNIPVGINDKISVVVQCPFSRTVKERDIEVKVDEDVSIDAAGYITGQYNREEAAMFGASEMQSAHRLRDQTQCQRRVKELVQLASIDPVLHDACNAAIKEVAHRRTKVPAKIPPPQTADDVRANATEITFDRPERTMSTHNCNRYELKPLPPAEVVLDKFDRMGTCTIMVCPVPKVWTGKKKKVPAWRSIDIDIFMPEGQVPAVHFQQETNHLLVVHQRADISPQSPYRYYCYMDVYDLTPETEPYKNGKKPTYKPIYQACFEFPKQIPVSGLLKCHLSKGDIMSVTLGSICLVVDPNVDDAVRLLTITHPLSVNGTKKNMISRACVFHYEGKAKDNPNDCGDDIGESFLIIGTVHGEAYHMNWISGNLIEAYTTPNVEAIYHFHYASNKLLMQTISAVHVVPLVKNKDNDPDDALAALFAPLSLPMVRPVASFLFGSQISCFSKYEQLFICSTIARRVTRMWEGIKEYESRCGHNFIAYDAIYATVNEIFLLQQDGVMRKIYWPLSESTGVSDKDDVPETTSE